MRKVIYISSPYTAETKEKMLENVHRQIQVADVLIEKGFAPLTPLLNHYQHELFPRSYDEWLEVDLAQVSKCDAVLRLSGESSGADKEVELANSLKIPVLYSVEQVVRHFAPDPLYSLARRLDKIGIKLYFVANYPWIYMVQVCKNPVKDLYLSRHNFTVAFQDGQKSKLTNIKHIFKTIRKYV